MTPEEEADALIASAVAKRKHIMAMIRHPAYSPSEEEREIIYCAVRSVLETAEWAK